MKKLLIIISIIFLSGFAFKNKEVDKKILNNGFYNIIKTKEIKVKNIINTKNENEVDDEETLEKKIKEYLSLKIEEETIVYKNMNMRELAQKLDHSMFYELDGHSKFLARETILSGVDPYLILAIILHESGCNGRCSNLVKYCNNIAGVKGYPGCGDSGFKKFDTIDDAISNLVKLIKRGYYNYGLDTPEKIAYKYSGGSDSWAGYIRYYMNLIDRR